MVRTTLEVGRWSPAETFICFMIISSYSGSVVTGNFGFMKTTLYPASFRARAVLRIQDANVVSI